LSVLAIAFAVFAIANGTLFMEIFLIPPLRQVDDYFSMAMAMNFLSLFTVFFTSIYVVKRLRNNKRENLNSKFIAHMRKA
jgi:hypothetical protein